MFDSGIYVWLAALCAGLAASSFALLIFDLLQNIDVEKGSDQQFDESKKLPFIFRIFMPLVPNVASVTKNSSFTGMRNSAQERIFMGGLDQTLNGEQFLAIRLLMLAAGVIFFGLFAMGSQTMAGLIFFAVCALYPSTWLRGIVRRRHLEILKSLPNVLDLLTLSVEAGKDFLTALRDIVARRKMDALNEELMRTLQEIQLGKGRQKALKEMAARVQQPELFAVVNSIVQADELGVSIGQLLRIQGDQLRGKRFARAEKLANEAPTKILGPVILFIFPSVFIILMGPILMKAMGTFMQ